MRQRDAGGGQEPERQKFVASFVEHAAAMGAPLLAKSLRFYAEAEEMSWEELASSLGCSPDQLNAIAVCGPPREERFVEDVEEIAAGIVPAERLLRLLREVLALEELASKEPSEGHVGAAGMGPASYLSQASVGEGLLLAARDREDDVKELPASGNAAGGDVRDASGNATNGDSGVTHGVDEGDD